MSKNVFLRQAFWKAAQPYVCMYTYVWVKAAFGSVRSNGRTFACSVVEMNGADDFVGRVGSPNTKRAKAMYLDFW